MNTDEIYAKIPHGKDDKPFLLFEPNKVMEYDIYDVDGPFAMTNKELVGCNVVLPFSKPMRTDIAGIATVNGKSVPVVVAMSQIWNMDIWWAGIKFGGALREYGQKATVTVSGFVDTDGNEMIPAQFTVHTAEKVKAKKEDIVHEKVALNAAEEGIVLLKNENGTLPLSVDETLNVFGKGQHEFRFCAIGAGKTNPRYNVSFLEAAEHSRFMLNSELSEFYACGEDTLPPEELVTKAKEKSDKAIMLISRSMGEGFDATSRKGEFYATDEEDALLKFLRKNFAKVIVILNTGYPIGTEFLEGADAILYTGFGGMLAGQAIVNVLNGTVNPSGKLPDTWAKRYEDIPSSKNFYNAVEGKPRIGTDCGEIWLDTVYEEGIYVGYRYFQTFGKEVGFPFGFGLSYTNFSIRAKGISYDGKSLHFTAEVANTGKVAGKETVQVYLKKPNGKIEKPVRELVDFEKTRLLSPKEMQTFSFSIPNSSMTSYDEETSSYVMEKGIYEVFVGSSVAAEKAGEFRLTADKTVQTVKPVMRPIEEIKELSQKDEKGTYPTGARSGVKEGVICLMPLRSKKNYPVRFHATGNSKKFSFEEVQKNPALLADFVSALTKEELARISICFDSGWSYEGTGEAGRIAQPNGFDLPEFVVADGNSGVNLKIRNVGMPSGATLAASFNKQLMEQVGRTIGEEAKALGISLILGPGFNLHRNPICGRQPEYFSEDPFLAGKMAGCYARGMENADVGACYKHFVCNNAETSRKRNQSILSERALRELYLATFRYAFEEYVPVSVMTAYNAVNGVMTCCDSELIQGFLRDELGFEGFVMTDWTSYDSADVVDMSAAGNCWITPGSRDNKFTDMILKGIEESRLSEERLRENVYYILKVVLGLSSNK